MNLWERLKATEADSLGSGPEATFKTSVRPVGTPFDASFEDPDRERSRPERPFGAREYPKDWAELGARILQAAEMATAVHLGASTARDRG